MYKGLYIAVVPYSVFANPSRSTPRISSLSTTGKSILVDTVDWFCNRLLPILLIDHRMLEANDNGCGGCHLVTEKVYASVDSPHSAGFGGAILSVP